MYNKDLNVFREGGSHAVNPIGGIPQGIGANGKPNLVEEGETAFDLQNGKYIFSDRLSLDNQMQNSLITEFNLPKYTKGKTFAEASKLIDKKFEGRNDSASLETKEALMERLQQAQEYIKMQNAMKVNSQEVPIMSDETPPGMNMFEEGGFTKFVDSGKMDAAVGGAGMIGDMIGGDAGNAIGSVAKGAQMGSALGPWGAAGGALLGGIGSLLSMGAKRKAELKKAKNDTLSVNSEANNLYSLGGSLDPDPIKKDNTKVADKSFKLDLLQKHLLNKSLYSDMSSFESNNVGEDLYNRSYNWDRNFIENLPYDPKNPERYFKYKKMAEKSMDDAQKEMSYRKFRQKGTFGTTKHKFTKEQNEFANNFSKGGLIDPEYPADPNKLIKSFKSKKDALEYANPYPERSNRWHMFDTYQKKLRDASFGQSSGDLSNLGYQGPVKSNPLIDELTYLKKMKSRPVAKPSKSNFAEAINNTIASSYGYGGKMYGYGGKMYGYGGNLYPHGGPIHSTSSLERKSLEQDLMKDLNALNVDINKKSDVNTVVNTDNNTESKFDLAKALQFAPAAGALLNRANLKKPRRESRAMISNKFQKDLMDEMRLQNIASNEFNNTAEAIANASGGSKAATRAGILGSGLNRNLALSRAYAQADDVNRQQSNMAQQFDFGVDRVNLYQDNLMKEVNARNEGAYETEKSKLNAALFNTIGNIGKEIIDKRTVAKMFGYSWDGKYMKDKQGNVIPPDVLKKQIEELKKKQNGSK